MQEALLIGQSSSGHAHNSCSAQHLSENPNTPRNRQYPPIIVQSIPGQVRTVQAIYLVAILPKENSQPPSTPLVQAVQAVQAVRLVQAILHLRLNMHAHKD
jgi:hypothetical protein